MGRPKKMRKEIVKKKAKKEPVQSVRGMHDILPDEQQYWDFFEKHATRIVKNFGFRKITVPMLEHTSLFARSIGEETDIVSKEMFTFTDRSGDSLSLRPEFTAGIARAYIEHGMKMWSQPIKLTAMGPLFRHERPQAGRYRQFHQLDVEILGDRSPVLDAETIVVCMQMFTSLGLADHVELHINSIGCPVCRDQYRQALMDYTSSKQQRLCSDCKKRVKKNPLRILDCKEPRCQAIFAESPHIVDFLCEECHKHFKDTLEYLDELELPYVLDPRLVRGLDYYTKTVFEFLTKGGAEGTAPMALGGGGRYDGLIELLGEKETSAVGAAIGIERVIEVMKRTNVPLPVETPQIFLAQLGEMAKRKSLKLFNMLVAGGFHVVESFHRDSIKSQLRVADKLGVKFTVILGQKEAVDRTVLLRDMSSGIQEVVDQQRLVDELKKRLGAPQSI